MHKKKYYLPNNLILNGFDRCGSSAVARTLANHPEIELIMQPFNSSSLREKTYKLMTEESSTQEEIAFFSSLEKNTLDTSFITSHWHEKFSTVGEFSSSSLNIIKTTMNHFTAAWVNECFPKIEQWGIWREPVDILSSIVRNGFHETWYVDAVPQIFDTVKESDELFSVYGSFIEKIDSNVKLVAFVMAVKTYFYFRNIDKNKIIFYDTFIKDPNLAVSYLLEYFSLCSYDFMSSSALDLNVTGMPFELGNNYTNVLPLVDKDFINAVLETLEQFSPKGISKL